MLFIKYSPGTALNTLDEAQLATLLEGVMEGRDFTLLAIILDILLILA